MVLLCTENRLRFTARLTEGIPEIELALGYLPPRLIVEVYGLQYSR